MKKNFLIILNSIISILIIGGILYFVGVEKVIGQFWKIDLGMLFLAILFLFIMDIFVAYRIRILLNELGEFPKFMGLLKSHFVGMFMADFTPARTGYFATAGILKYKYKIPSEKALVSIFGPQIFDFAFKLVVGGISILYITYKFLNPKDSWVILIGAPVMAAIIAVMLLVLFSKKFLSLFAFVERIPVANKIYALVKKMQEKSGAVVKKTPEILGLLFITWTLKAISWYFVGKAVGITLNTEFPEVFFYFFLQPLITMLEFIPSPTIAGLGISEGGSTLVFSLFGIPPYKAAAFALLARFKTTLLHTPAVPEVLDTLKRNKKEGFNQI